jgi:hypothetical protein
MLGERLSQISLTDAQKSLLLHYLDILFLEDSLRDVIERQLRPDSGTEVTLEMAYQAEILFEWAKLQTDVDKPDGYEHDLSSLVRRSIKYRGHPGSKGDVEGMVVGMAVKERLRLAMLDRYNFKRVRRHIDNLPDNETKIAYLIEIRTEYRQVGETSEHGSKGFARKCELEIKKLKGLSKIAWPGKLIALTPNDVATNEKAATPQRGWPEKEYLILAVSAAKAIGRRGNKLTDERMAEEMDCSRRTALTYRGKYANAYNTTVRSAYEEGLREYTSERNKP